MLKGKKISFHLMQLCIEAGFAITLVVINIIRILNIPITIDETGYQKNDSYSNLVQEKLGHANNHIFHSLLRKFFAELFTDDLFFLRLDSLIAQVLYLVYSWLICRVLFTNKWWQFCSFIILNISSPFLFNFWGLSRGYALSVTCMTISIYYLLKYLIGRRALFLSISYLGAILAVYSNFSLLNYFVTLFSVIILQIFLFKNNLTPKGYLAKQIAISLFALAILAILITAPLMHIYHFGELSFMGNSGFINDTVKSLVGDGLYLRDPSGSVVVRIISWSLIFTSILSGFYWIFNLVRSRYLKINTVLHLQYGVVLCLLLIIPAISIIGQHLLFNINYITDRAALFFIPLLLLCLLYSLSVLKQQWDIASTAIITCLMLVLSYNFIININTTSTLLWWFDADDLHVLKRITDDSKNKQGKLKIHTYWIFGPAFYYDTHKYYPDKFENLNWDNMSVLGIDTSYDFYYVVSTDNTDTLVKYYHRDGSYLGGGATLYKKN